MLPTVVESWRGNCPIDSIQPDDLGREGLPCLGGHFEHCYELLKPTQKASARSELVYACSGSHLPG